MKVFGRNRLAFISYISCLLWPGHAPYVLEKIDQTVVPVDQAWATGWSEEDLRLLLDEGRRHHDSSIADLSSSRARAQLTLTTGLAVLGFLASQLHTTIAKRPDWSLAVLSLSALLAFLAALGSLALLAVHIAAPAMHPGVLASYPAPRLRRVADDYAMNAADWERVLGTMRTVLREALLYLTAGSVIAIYAYIAVHI